MSERTRFDEALDALRGMLLEMGGLAEEMIHYSAKLIIERDPAHIAKVKEDEEKVNQLHIDIDEYGIQLIALHQPAAGDLRLIAAALKINSDLERIGDQAVNIAETGTYFLQQPEMKLGDVPRMTQLASSMVKDSLDAFARKDVGLAREVIKRDDEEDRLKSQTFSELVQIMQSDASTIQRGLHIILISRNLERIADHAVNIAEDVIFMVQGKDMRHGGAGPTEAAGVQQARG